MYREHLADGHTHSGDHSLLLRLKHLPWSYIAAAVHGVVTKGSKQSAVDGANVALTHTVLWVPIGLHAHCLAYTAHRPGNSSDCSDCTDSIQIQCLHTHCLAYTAHGPGNSSDCSDCTDSAHFSNRLHTDPMSAHPLSDTYCKHMRKQFWPFRLHRLYIDPSLHTHTHCRDKETWTCTPTVHCVKTLTAFCLPKCQNRKWRCACSVKEV